MIVMITLNGILNNVFMMISDQLIYKIFIFSRKVEKDIETSN